MERQAKDGTIYRQVGQDQWTPVTRTAKDGTVYKKVGEDQWSPLDPPKSEGPGVGTSVTRGVEQGATLGYSDEIAGGIEAAGQAFGIEGLGANNFSELGFTKPKILEGTDAIKDAYVKRRDQQREEIGDAREANPKAFMTGEVGGAIASGFIPGMAPARGAKLASVAARSAGVGAAAGAGYSEADNLGDLAKDTAAGMAIGAVVPVGLKGAGATLKGAGKATGWASRKFLSSVGGVSDDLIKTYMKNPERIRNAQTWDELYDSVTQVVNKLDDDLDKANIDFDFAKAQLDDVAESIKSSRVDGKATALDQVKRAKESLEKAFADRKQVIAEKASPSRIEPMVTDALEGLKARVDDGIAVAEEALERSGQAIKSKSMITSLRRISNDLAEDFSDDAVAAKGKIDKYIEILGQRGDEMPLKDARRFMKNIRDDVGAWGREKGGHTGVYDRSLQKAQGTIDKRLKNLSPEYDATMSGVADDMGVLDSARKLYGKDQTRLSRLEGTWRPSAKTQRESLEALAQKQGGELPKAVDSMVDAQRTLKSPTRLDTIKQGLPETKALRDAEQAAGVAKRMANPRRIKEAIKGSAAFQKMKSTQARQQQAKEIAKKFRMFGEQNAQSRLKAVARGHRHATKSLRELSELTDQDFVEAVKATADAAAFNKTNFNGSRNVNFWSAMGMVGQSLVGRGGGGAAAGFIFGGPVGLMLGAATGAMMDVYGPRVTKKILDGVIKIKGPISEKAIMGLDLPEKVKLDLVQGFRNAITSRPASADQALQRVASDEASRPKTATRPENGETF